MDPQKPIQALHAFNRDLGEIKTQWDDPILREVDQRWLREWPEVIRRYSDIMEDVENFSRGRHDLSS